MNDAGVNWHMLIMGGVAHSFTNPIADSLGIPGVAYDEAADALIWRQMRDFHRDCGV